MRYGIADGALSAFSVFFMQSGSFLAHQRLLEKKKGRSNARSLFQVDKIPSDPQIRNLLDPLSSSDFQEDFWFLLDSLKEDQSLLQFRTELNTCAIAMDGVNFFFFRKNLVFQLLEAQRPKWDGTFLPQCDYTSLC